MSRIQAKNLRRFWKLETPAGAVNGTNKAFTMTETPLENDAVLVFVNGLLREQGSDYSISGKVITFVTAPAVAQKVTVQYVQNVGGE